MSAVTTLPPVPPALTATDLEHAVSLEVARACAEALADEPRLTPAEYLRRAIGEVYAGRTPITAANRVRSVYARVCVHRGRAEELAAIRHSIRLLRDCEAQARREVT